MKKQKQSDLGLMIIAGTLALIFVILLFWSIFSTAQYIGLGSALQLSVCHPSLTDAQCIGQEKARIISNLQNDGRDTHGTQIFYGNRKTEIPDHEDILLKQKLAYLNITLEQYYTIIKQDAYNHPFGEK